jgi:hypothetical protein
MLVLLEISSNGRALTLALLEIACSAIFLWTSSTIGMKFDVAKELRRTLRAFETFLCNFYELFVDIRWLKTYLSLL